MNDIPEFSNAQYKVILTNYTIVTGADPARPHMKGAQS